MILQTSVTTVQNATGAIAPELGALGGPCALYSMLAILGTQIVAGVMHRFGINIPVLTPAVNWMAVNMASRFGSMPSKPRAADIVIDPAKLNLTPLK
jgi:hypothetical protein